MVGLSSLREDFQHQNHSLSINASEVAVCAGCHEYKSVPELLLSHVYQGRGGQALLQHDVHLLGLNLVSEEEQLLELAAQAGPATTEALTKALQVKHGETRVESIEMAQQMRQEVMKRAAKSKKLTKQQLTSLEEQTRHSIDTGCGHSWEDEALDQYQKQCGWDVRRRNEECRIWHFEKSELGNDKKINATEPGELHHRQVTPSLCPVGPAVPFSRKRTRPVSEESSNSTLLSGRENVPIDLTTETMENSKTVAQSSSGAPAVEESPAYFLSIKGMVDGIRDELMVVERVDNKDDDDWILRTVVVECKHRMRSLLPYPRFYECIQAVVYCQMYDADEADIVQVLRKSKTSNADTRTLDLEMEKAGEEETTSLLSEQETQREPWPTADESPPQKKRLLTEHFPRLPSNSLEHVKLKQMVDGGDDDDIKGNIEEYPDKPDDWEEKTDEDGAVISEKVKPSTVDMEIAVSRISLHDQFNHLDSWNTIVLPRLREWTECVYRIRKSDDLRYRLLSSMAIMESTDDPRERQRHIQVAWELAFEQCPFLKVGYSFECYRRELSTVPT
ncbi:hypothetical protein IV203_016247 [Nitzschia inconspicua]|uniref:Uncharacterized protein n=1 Tax=Nitzschia inconspicua TaxID=303405 RepID=A0A9K3KQ78_9STRA|nr:hypothetical protein IV203_017462 [Nitzschia inconspicua]KAG7347542.1 hypothetical protein IV203_016247 [Nitzschia inconspicua]